jgi:SAM-dependent methyltransferase
VNAVKIGVQQNGSSSGATKQMAIAAKTRAVGTRRLQQAVDIAGGAGEFSLILATFCDFVLLTDYAPPSSAGLPAAISVQQLDLNHDWAVVSESFDFAFALECIEHIENPRHFMREIARIIKRGGHAFISTPNNESLASKFTFLVRGQHRYFQEAGYPAHISPLLHCDFERMASECGFQVVDWFYSGSDTVPRLRWKIPFGGKLFSDTMGVLLVKP